MKRVPAAEFVRNFSSLCDEAMSQPVVMTRNGRDRLVVVKVEYFQKLTAAASGRAEQEGMAEVPPQLRADKA